MNDRQSNGSDPLLDKRDHAPRQRTQRRRTHADDLITRNRQAGMLACGIAIVVAFALDPAGPLTPAKAVVLGVVEGITEFLPISSTGHLLVTQHLLGLGDGPGKKAADTYAVVIQFGAILAVVALYRHRILQMLRGLVGYDEAGRGLLTRLTVAFAPAATVGYLFSGIIKEQLFGLWPVVSAWLIGGLLLVWWRPKAGTLDITSLTNRHAAIIGAAQTLALWPGVSRSLATVVAALAIGMTMSAALEFSFLLGLATLSAATLYDLNKSGSTLVADYGIVTPILGGVVAFATAVVAVRWLVATLRTRPLAIFGWYRIAIAILAGSLIWAGAI